MVESKEFIKLVGIVREREVCKDCHHSIKYQIVHGRMWFVLFHIPLIPLKGQYYFECPSCSVRTPISKEEARKTLENARRHIKK